MIPTPKEKSKDLLDKMTLEIGKFNSKQCALIAVEEILNTLYSLRFGNALDDELEYWEEVKEEIVKS
jgi:hypothetical protein